jgi:hypothetical protein
MTPKEKAKELVENFKFDTKQSEIINEIILGDISVIFQHHKAKQCALIAVDEVIKVCPYFDEKKRDTEDQFSAFDFQFVSYWQEVKHEINQL